MASGFLILADGRCFARRWSVYDVVLRAVAEQLNGTPQARALHEWLLSLLPGPDDIDDVGYGPWVRKSDQQLVERLLDLRELAPENQRLFHEAVRRVGEWAQSPLGAECPDWLRQCLADLADIATQADRGEPPLNRSDWSKVLPSEGRHLGPGWGCP